MIGDGKNGEWASTGGIPRHTRGDGSEVAGVSLDISCSGEGSMRRAFSTLFPLVRRVCTGTARRWRPTLRERLEAKRAGFIVYFDRRGGVTGVCSARSKDLGQEAVDENPKQGV